MATRQSLTSASAARSSAATPAKTERLPFAVVSKLNPEVYYSGDVNNPSAKYAFDIPVKKEDRGTEKDKSFSGIIEGQRVSLEFDRNTKEGASRYVVLDKDSGELVCAFFRNARDLGASALTERDRMIFGAPDVEINLDDL